MTITSFRPLRFWGYLYLYYSFFPFPILVLDPFVFGVIYIIITIITHLMIVLDPFVFGVIYIPDVRELIESFGFRPLRFWGYLYLKETLNLSNFLSFRPLRFWGYLYPIQILNGIFVDIENPLFIFYHKFTKNQYSKIRFCFFNIFSPKANSPDKIFILLN